MRKSNLIKLFILAVILGLVLSFALLRREPHPVAIGDAAPDFTLSTLTGDSVLLHNYRKQVVVLNLWATWCPPCVEETPSLERFAEEMRDQGVTVIGISVDKDRVAVQEFADRFHISYPIALDSDQAVANRYGTYKFPETYILDRDGKVAERLIGAVNWQDPRITSFVQELTRGLTRQAQ